MVTKLIKEYSKKLEIEHETVDYLRQLKNKLESDSQFIQRANNQANKINKEEALSDPAKIKLEDVVLYCVIYQTDLTDKELDILNVDILRRENVLKI